MYEVLSERLFIIAKMSREWEIYYYPGVPEPILYSAGITVNYGVVVYNVKNIFLSKYISLKDSAFMLKTLIVPQS